MKQTKQNKKKNPDVTKFVKKKKKKLMNQKIKFQMLVVQLKKQIVTQKKYLKSVVEKKLTDRNYEIMQDQHKHI